MFLELELHGKLKFVTRVSKMWYITKYFINNYRYIHIYPNNDIWSTDIHALNNPQSFGLNYGIIKLKTHMWIWVSHLLVGGVLNIDDFDPLDMLNNCLMITYMMIDEVRSDGFEQIISGTGGFANRFLPKLLETINIQYNVIISWYWSAKW